jgi:elongation factor P
MKAKDVRKGSFIMHKNEPYRVMDFHHHTPGNLRAMVQTKLRNLINGNQTEVRFSSTEDIPEADVYRFDASYLYGDSEGYHFMNTQTFEEVTISDDLISDGKYYLQDGMVLQLLTFNGNPIGVTLPDKVTVTIVETEPSIKGATVTNVQKPAKIETGLSIQVPGFIKTGDRIIVSTEDGRYLSRAD